MRLVLASAAVVALFGATAIAQTNTQGSGSSASQPMTQSGSTGANSGTSNPAVNVKPAGSPESTGAVQPGANSFTEGQARSRIEAQGYTNISELKKDDQGMWRGRAMRNGSSVNVMLDFKGNVATQ
jgi:ABC-type phosphate transport system substrate-binding protein